MKSNSVSQTKIMQRIHAEFEISEQVVAYENMQRTAGEWAEDFNMSSLEFAEKLIGPLCEGGPKLSEIDVTKGINHLLKLKKKYFYNNKAYSKSELSRICGCSTSEFGKRLEEGMTITEAVEMGRYRRDIVTVDIEVNGEVETHTVSEWCKIFKLDRTVYDARMRMGWDREKALKTPVAKKTTGGRTPRMITYNRETHSIKEWCEIRGMSRGTFYQRVNSGMSEQEALRLDVHDYRLSNEKELEIKKKEIRVAYLGINRTLQQWSYITGFNYIVLRERYIRGMSPEEILTTQLHKRV